MPPLATTFSLVRDEKSDLRQSMQLSSRLGLLFLLEAPEPLRVRYVGLLHLLVSQSSAGPRGGTAAE